MVAFNFMERFADDVASGVKPGSIRQKKKCKVGDKIQLYTGQRTKNCRKIGDAVCVHVCPVTINNNGYEFHFDKMDGFPLIRKEPIYILDGFDDKESFIDFFRQNYGLPFSGYYHQWTLVGEN